MTREISMKDGESGNERLAAFDGELAGVNMTGQWKFEALLQKAIGGPAPAGIPFKWSWETISTMLDKSCGALKETTTVRRTLSFSNPALPVGSTHALLGAVQMVLPGEVEWTHSHAISALRFVIDGVDGLSTVVDGEHLPMAKHDLILTPAWAKHDHHNDGDRPGVWLDVLDLPIVAGLKQMSYRVPNTKSQELDGRPRADADSRSHFLRRRGVVSTAGSPRLRFPWAETETELSRQASQGVDPCDGVMLEYFDPFTGESVLPTLSCNVQLLPAGFTGVEHRKTASSLCYVMEGSGTTSIEGHTDIDWKERDVFVLPNWVWHAHRNQSTDERALLFVVTEAALLRTMGLDRSERR